MKAKKFCTKDDVMIGRYGPPVFQILRGLEGAYNVALMKAIPNESLITKDYLFNFLSSPSIQDYIIGLSQRSAGQSGVNKKALEDYPILVPPISVQNRIVDILENSICKINTSISLLEENLKYSKAFLLSILDEEFGKLDCKQVEIGQILEKTSNMNPITELKDGEFTYIDITSINNVQYSIDNPKILKGKDAPSRAKKALKYGDIVFATTRPNLKNIAIVNKDYINPIASTGFCVLRPLDTKLNNEYLFYFLTSQKVQELITPFIKGAQYPAISDKDLLSIKIPLPNSISEQKKIVSTIKLITDTTNRFINEIQIKLDNMKALKSSLLDQAFKGEL
ncbi:restriction endonuclease subunit S [Sphingobacterium sp. IITKGP-BTPF85]|uniref:restriction endonuclease subunit S n=1 Tax=Sphingobacterium sp. IITKGP-BTPF85 TaxID=1338009 RepID=UPI0021D10371|nr:restriction endonuclease subunit S [Sphingobacterium sp. IITKGP-BTPF85]